MSTLVASNYPSDKEAVVYPGSCFDFVKSIPDHSIKLIVTSPPYNIGKTYEKKVNLDKYYEEQEKIIGECVRILSADGNLCWQTGNFVENFEITPLDIFLYPIFRKYKLKLRNRIVWHFGHGLHTRKRFSGRYETIMWYTKTNHYTFNLDAVREPQKYPNKKYFKGPKMGKLSCHPLGKNPSDIWEIPNVKNNHIEKTIHPCQFPVELIERLVLALTNEGDWVFDPFLGVGSAIVAAVKNKRKGMGSEVKKEYASIARERTDLTLAGKLKTRPMYKPIYNPKHPKENLDDEKNTPDQFSLFRGNVKLETG